MSDFFNTYLEQLIAQRRVSIIYGYTSFFVLFNYRNKAAV